MWAVLTSEFFWGVIIGLILSIIGGYGLAIFQTNSQSKAQKLIFRDFSVDTVKNVKQIIDEMDDIRSRTGAIHLDFLVLMEVEIGVFGRNREHLTRLPEKPRERLRKLLNSIAIKRAEAVNYLTEFYRQVELADQLFAQGQGPQSQRIRNTADAALARANKAVDQIVAVSQNSTSIISELEGVR
jgi:hypothetical protein